MYTYKRSKNLNILFRIYTYNIKFGEKKMSIEIKAEESKKLKQNKWDLFEKLSDVLFRNKGAVQIKIERKAFDPYIFFKMSSFSTCTIENIFSYWGLDWRDHVKEFRASANNNMYVRVLIFLTNPDQEMCEHEFVFNDGWKRYICKKCGYFAIKKEVLA